MQYKLLKKEIVFGIILLFVRASITSSLGISNSNDDNTPPITTISLDPPEPNGLNGWYVSNVTVILEATDDISGVKEIRYRVAEGLWKVYYGNLLIFILDHDCLEGFIEFYSVDYSGNKEETKSVFIKIDKLPPEMNVKVDVEYHWCWYDILFSIGPIEDMCSSRGMSGMWCIDITLNDILQEIVTGPGPIYEWGFRFYGGLKVTIKIQCSDWAGNQAVVVWNSSDINFRPKVHNNQPYIDLLFLRFFERFPLLERIINIFGWNVV